MKRIVGRTIVLLLSIVLVAQVLNVMPVRAQTASVSVTPDPANVGYPVLITGTVMPEGIYSLQIMIREEYHTWETFGPISTTEYGEFQLTYVPSSGVGTYYVGVVESGGDIEFPIGSTSFVVSERTPPGLAISGAYGPYGQVAAVVQKGDGGYAIAGTLDDPIETGDAVGFILELSAGGGLLYTPPMTFSYPLGTDSVVTDMIPYPTDGYVLTGYATDAGGVRQPWVVKVGFTGTLVFNNVRIGMRDRTPQAIVSTYDINGNLDGYAIAGTADGGPSAGPEMYLGMIGLDGTWMWDKEIGGPVGSVPGTGQGAYSIAATSDGGLVLAGNDDSAGLMDFYLVRTDHDGNILGRWTYDNGGFENAESVIQTADGGFALGGRQSSADGWLVKTDAGGVLQWEQDYGSGVGGGGEGINDILQTSDDGFVLVGEAEVALTSMYSFWIVRTDSAGHVLWRDSYYDYQNRPGAYCSASCVVQTSDGGYFLAGDAQGIGYTDVMFVKTAPAGMTISNEVFAAPSGPNVMDWSYQLGANATMLAAFSLPNSEEGGSVSIPELPPGGIYWIDQETKYGWDTTVEVDSVVSPVDVYATFISVSLYLGGAPRSVKFTSEPYDAFGRPNTDTSSPTLSTIYNIPCWVAVPVQASWDPNFKGPEWSTDIVKDKPMTILVNLTDALTSGKVALTDETVSISIGFPGPDSLFPSSLAATTTGNRIKNGENTTVVATNPPNVLGSHEITCTISYRGVDISTETTTVLVKETSDVLLHYIRLTRPEYGSVTDSAFNTMIANTWPFVQTVLPTASVVWSHNDTSHPGQAVISGFASRAMLIDCQYASLETDLLYGFNTPNSIGVAIGPYQTSNKNYFKYHGAVSAGKTAVGVSFGHGVKGVVVMDGYYSAVAHEVGHTYDLYYPGREEYEDFNPGIRTNGFSPEANTWRSGTDFMGLSVLRSTTSVWVNTNPTWYNLTTSLKTPNDPPILLVNGIINSDDTVDIAFPWYTIPYGTPDTIPTGRFGLRFTTDTGPVETRFDAQFLMNLDPGIELGEDLPTDFTGFGCIPVDFAGFAFATAYPTGTTLIELVDHGIDGTEDNVIKTVLPESVIPSVSSYFGGFLQPINNDGSSIFKFKSVVPIKFQLQEPQGGFITTATAKLTHVKVSNGVTGDELEATTNVAATTGNLFRYDPTNNLYIYNLDTKQMSRGTWQLTVTFEDGLSKTVLISLK